MDGCKKTAIIYDLDFIDFIFLPRGEETHQGGQGSILSNRLWVCKVCHDTYTARLMTNLCEWENDIEFSNRNVMIANEYVAFELLGDTFDVEFVRVASALNRTMIESVKSLATNVNVTVNTTPLAGVMLAPNSIVPYLKSEVDLVSVYAVRLILRSQMYPSLTREFVSRPITLLRMFSNFNCVFSVLTVCRMKMCSFGGVFLLVCLYVYSDA